MEFNQSFKLPQTLILASDDNKLKTCVKNWCKQNSKVLILSEPKSPDIIAFNTFAVIADPEFVGKENMDGFVEMEKSKKFEESIYEDEELFKFHQQYFDLNKNGKLFIEPTKLLLTNELNPDEIISRLDEFVKIYKNNFRE